MTSLVFYFQVHQPYRIKAYPFDAIGYLELRKLDRNAAAEAA